jgi:transcriptional regulator with XRE-family HTH domain
LARQGKAGLGRARQGTFINTGECMETSGELIKYRRKELGMSQLDVSLCLGYSGTGDISKWESGEIPIPPSVVPRIATVLHIDHRDIIAAIAKESLRKAREVQSEME